MARYEMSTQPAIGAQGPFEIDERARFHELQIRPLPGFLEQIELRELEKLERQNGPARAT